MRPAPAWGNAVHQPLGRAKQDGPVTEPCLQICLDLEVSRRLDALTSVLRQTEGRARLTRGFS
jgi:hypothetical protein